MQSVNFLKHFTVWYFTFAHILYLDINADKTPQMCLTTIRIGIEYLSAFVRLWGCMNHN